MEILFFLDQPDLPWNNSAHGPRIALSDMQHTLHGAKPVPASYLQERLNKNNTIF